MMPPRSFTSCNSLPPEGAARLRPGKAGSAARTGEGTGAPSLSEGAVPSLRQRFDEVREAVITAPREPVALRNEIVAMREKVRMGHKARPRAPLLASEPFDVKHSAGGMVDAEFAVQFLVLSQSAQHPELIANVGNIALLQRAEAAGLLPEGVGQRAAAAYRELRRVQHQARLNEEPTEVAPPALQAERDAILALWCAVFEAC